MITSREVALDVINRVNESGSYANLLLPKVFERVQMESRDKAFTTELVYGTLRNQGTLDWIIEQFSSKKIKQLSSKKLADILRLGVYQIYYLNGVPDRAAVNETVELSKKYFHKGTTDFVNAVLRKISDNKENVSYNDLKKDFSKYLAIRYSHPEWITNLMISQYGEKTAEEVCKADNRTPEICLRVNTMRISHEAFAKQLSKHGLEFKQSEIVPDAFIVKKPGAISDIFGWNEGLFFVQDQSSLLVGLLVNPDPTDRIIDACAAPGGKTVHSSVLMNNKGYIIASDASSQRLALLDLTRERLGLKNIIPLAVDARRLNKYVKRTVNKALVDAPCTGLGTLARRADERWRKTPEMLKELPKIQGEILNTVSSLVKKNGILVYSVCTWTKEETECVCRNFLEKHPEYQVDDISNELPRGMEVNTPYGIQILPHQFHSDGMFIARFVKTQ